MYSSLYGSYDISLLDNNECLSGNGGCQEVCVNTNGSYYCDCQTGYRLKSDNNSCIGKYIKLVYIKLWMFVFDIVSLINNYHSSIRCGWMWRGSS